MKTISLAVQKGGAGKSTAATNLAVAFARTGFKTAILDMDTQGTCFSWGKLRKKSDIKMPLTLSVNPASLTDTIEGLNERGCDVAFIDTRGAGDTDAAKAIKASDFVLVPVQPSDADLRALGLTLDMVDYAKKESFTFLNRCPHNGNDADRAEVIIRNANGNVSGIRLFERKAYKRAMGAGLSVEEWRDPHDKRLDLAAVAEVQKLFSFTLGKLGVAT